MYSGSPGANTTFFSFDSARGTTTVVRRPSVEHAPKERLRDSVPPLLHESDAQILKGSQRLGVVVAQGRVCRGL